MYKPKLKYIFCLMRKRSLMPAMSVMRYMNSVGIVPQLLIDSKYRLLIVEELNRYRVEHIEINSLPDFDVMFCEGGGHTPFERRWLKQSTKQGKSNVILLNGASPYQEFEASSYHRKFIREGMIQGLCAKIGKTVLYQKKFFEPLFLINTGDPDWDWWQTDEFKKKVEDVKLELGDKILVLCENFILSKESIPYDEFCIKRAESLGFKVIINVHPDRPQLVPKHFYKYWNTNIHHHVLFAAATHAISSIASSVICENLFLKTKVGCNQAVFHCDKQGRHKWLSRDAWLTVVSKHVDPKILNIISTIFDEKDLDNFLSSRHNGSIALAEKAFGRVDVSNYTEYLFKVLDERLKK